MSLNKPTGDMLNAAATETPQGLGTAAVGTSLKYAREDHVHAVPTFSGDVSNTGTAVTVGKIQGNSVSGSAPASGQVLTWDGSQWAPAQSTGGGGGGANGLTYYLNQGTAPDSPTTGLPAGVKQLGRSGETAQTTVTTATLTPNQWTTVASFISESTPIDPDVNSIPAGLWDFNVWAFGDANANAGTVIRAVASIYNGTTLTTLGTSSSQVINGTSAQYSLSVLVPQTTVALTDRIFVAIETMATAQNHTVTAQFGDSTPSHVHTSLPLVGGTGLWKSVAGVLQSPASLLVNADVDAAAGIAWSKIAPSYFGSRVKIVGRDAATIQGCIDLCTDADGDHCYTVLIPPTTTAYVENLTLKNSVSLFGLATALQTDSIQIKGAHTYAPASTQVNSNRIGFQNISFVSTNAGANTITVSSSTKYLSQLRFTNCYFSGDKSNTFSHISTDDNCSLYLDNCRIESSAGGASSAGVTQGNAALYISNGTLINTYGRALDVPASATTTRTATSVLGAGGATLTLTSGTTSGLAVGMKVSGSNLLPNACTIVSLTAPSTVVLSSISTIAAGSFTVTFGQTPYVEIHDAILWTTGASEIVRLQGGLLTANNSNFTSSVTGGSGSGLNLTNAGTIVGVVNSSFTIADSSATAYAITGAAGTYAALYGVAFSNSALAPYNATINSAVTVLDYTGRATSIENGGTGATTRQAAINALAGATTANQVLAGNGTNITLRALAAADIPSLDTGKLTTGTLPVTRGGTGVTTSTGTGAVMLGTVPTLSGFTENVNALGTIGASATLSLTSSNFITATLTSGTPCTLTMPTPVAGKTFVLLIKQPATGSAATITFSGVKFPAGTTYSFTLGRMDIVQFRSDGTSWFANILGKDYTY